MQRTIMAIPIGRVRAAGIVCLVAFVLGACTAPAGATSATPQPDSKEVASLPTAAGDLAEDVAIAKAREAINAKNAEVWATRVGSYNDVYLALAHRPDDVEQPDPDAAGINVKDGQRVWGVQFKLQVEICGPSGSNCEVRDALRTVLIDAESGDWLRTSTFAPSAGEELPRP